MNIHGAHSYWKQGALGDAGVRLVWAGAGLQHAGYRGRGILCGLAKYGVQAGRMLSPIGHNAVKGLVHQLVIYCN